MVYTICGMLIRGVAPFALALAGALASTTVAGASLRWTAQDSGVSARLRGISAVSAQVAWAAGNHGVVLRTVDGGRHWSVLRIPGAEELDLRDIEAFDARTAYVLSAGSGAAARIYKTDDGGARWSLQFVNENPAGFYNAIAFWTQDRGLAFGDPIAGRFVIMRTDDGGRNWRAAPANGMPAALPGEAAFAASGACLVTVGAAHAFFGTGGAARARVFRTSDAGESWTAAETPVAAGRDSAGVFALAFESESRGLAVGGDYRRTEESSLNLVHTVDTGAHWMPSGAGRLPGFRSALAFLPRSGGPDLVVVGPAGSDISADGGATWKPAGVEELHAVSSARSGEPTGWAVGERGRVYKLSLGVDASATQATDSPQQPNPLRR